MLHRYIWYNLKLLYDHHIAVLIDLNSLLYIYHEMCEQLKCIYIYIYHNVSAECVFDNFLTKHPQKYIGNNNVSLRQKKTLVFWMFFR